MRQRIGGGDDENSHLEKERHHVTWARASLGSQFGARIAMPSLKQNESVEQEANRFGFCSRQVPLGFFIAPIRKNRFGHPHIGSDQMLIKHNGEIVVYEHDAQAFLAATAVRNVLAALQSVKEQAS
jgi:hypothetical protein